MLKTIKCVGYYRNTCRGNPEGRLDATSRLRSADMTDIPNDNHYIELLFTLSLTLL